MYPFNELTIVVNNEWSNHKDFGALNPFRGETEYFILQLRPRWPLSRPFQHSQGEKPGTFMVVIVPFSPYHSEKEIEKSFNFSA